MDLPSTVQDSLERVAVVSIDDLPSILDQLQPRSHPESAIVEAFIYWRLQRYSDQLSVLQSYKDDLKPYSQYWSLLGLCLGKLDFPSDDVVSAYMAALQIDPSRHDIYFNIANYYVDFDPSLAAEYYMHSIQLDAYFSLSWQNLGILLRDNFSVHEAIKCFKNTLLLSPSDSETYSNLGLCFISTGNFQSAESCFLRAITLHPDFPSAYINLTNLLLSCRRPQDSIDLIASYPSGDLPGHLLFNLSLCHLLMGNFETGWKLYENRFLTDQVPPDCFPTFGRPISSLDGLDPSIPLVVWAEQGHGDAIQFSRYLLLLDRKNINYEFHCQPELIPLFKDWLLPNCPIFPLTGRSDSSDQRVHCPLLSLPYLCSTSLSTIPFSTPYLRSPGNIPAHLTVQTPSSGFSVGILWSSNSVNQRMYQNKSVSLHTLLSALQPYTSLNLCTLNALKYKPTHAESCLLASAPFVVDWSPYLKNYSDTAHIVSQLDLVITVDTAVAHLSAAMGRPTWLLLPWDADFRWLRERSDSPWYTSSLRLFRQPSRHDWDALLNSVCDALDEVFLLDVKALSESRLNQ